MMREMPTAKCPHCGKDSDLSTSYWNFTGAVKHDNCGKDFWIRIEKDEIKEIEKQRP